MKVFRDYNNDRAYVNFKKFIEDWNLEIKLERSTNEKHQYVYYATLCGVVVIDEGKKRPAVPYALSEEEAIVGLSIYLSGKKVMVAPNWVIHFLPVFEFNEDGWNN